MSATSDAYRAFADTEARGYAPILEHLAHSVADDDVVIEFVDSLPPGKRQPNLLFAAVRFLDGEATVYERFRSVVVERPDELRETMLHRSTQTNEPGRCATLLPLLARLAQPLALLEVGASAGLCLFPDR
jgi:hypothetical protein